MRRNILVPLGGLWVYIIWRLYRVQGVSLGLAARFRKLRFGGICLGSGV